MTSRVKRLARICRRTICDQRSTEQQAGVELFGLLDADAVDAAREQQRHVGGRDHRGAADEVGAVAHHEQVFGLGGLLVRERVVQRARDALLGVKLEFPGAEVGGAHEWHIAGAARTRRRTSHPCIPGSSTIRSAARSRSCASAAAPDSTTRTRLTDTRQDRRRQRRHHGCVERLRSRARSGAAWPFSRPTRHTARWRAFLAAARRLLGYGGKGRLRRQEHGRRGGRQPREADRYGSEGRAEASGVLPRQSRASEHRGFSRRPMSRRAGGPSRLARTAKRAPHLRPHQGHLGGNPLVSGRCSEPLPGLQIRDAGRATADPRPRP
jgi:hypothetical protein